MTDDGWEKKKKNPANKRNFPASQATQTQVAITFSTPWPSPVPWAAGALRPLLPRLSSTCFAWGRARYGPTKCRDDRRCGTHATIFGYEAAVRTIVGGAIDAAPRAALGLFLKTRDRLGHELRQHLFRRRDITVAANVAPVVNTPAPDTRRINLFRA